MFVNLKKSLDHNNMTGHSTEVPMECVCKVWEEIIFVQDKYIVIFQMSDMEVVFVAKGLQILNQK